MHLSMDVARLIAVQALRGRTWAGNRVFDSPSLPANLQLEEERAPFVAVYCDDADQGRGADGEDGSPVTFSLDLPRAWLVIECGIATSITIDPETREVVVFDPADQRWERADGTEVPNPATVVTLSETDAAQEMQIGFMGQQVINALQDHTNPWSELWRLHAASGIRKLEVRRGGEGMPGTEGVKYASRIMRLRLELTPTPPQGGVLEPGGFWDKFFITLAGIPALAKIGDLMKMHLTLPQGGTLIAWREAQRLMGVTEEAVRALGFSPEVTPEDDQYVLQSAATVDPTDTDGSTKRELDLSQMPPVRPPGDFPYPDL